ncbi:MAG TPA: type VI secretion system baseplate subunit TssF [Candidatus Acidoferrum sp.]|jgi:type VI secretion system protein ImpG|nr:type VI secretion system baseplate subunit TssF [Candidatus Acidoferrum sp.]
MRDELLLYYERELDYLRKLAAQFAEKNPKVASRLVLEPTKCEDPHVERLLEGFAFLAARVHLKIDDEFPEISEALLSVVYPQLVRPLPSMSIVEFQLDPEKGKLTTGLPVARGSTLFSKPVAGVPCTFRTCYETTIWPVTVTAGEWRAPSRLHPPVRATDSTGAIRLELRAAPDVNLKELKIDKLRFYLDGEGGLVNTIYELLFSRLNRIVVRDPTPGSKVPPVVLPPSALKPVGFELNEGMLPYAERSFAGHRLLLEYFAFPEKFLFVDLAELGPVWEAGFKDAVEFVFLISEVPGEERRQRLELELSKKTFRLGCSPIANLFTQVAEPIQLNLRRYEYPLVPDVRRPYSTEIFSVDEVNCINTATQQTTPFEPFYSLRHSSRNRKASCFWLARRRPSERPNDEGTDTFLSLVDLSMQSMNPDSSILSIKTTCTNRDLPSRLPFGGEEGDFELEGSSSFKRIVSLRKPTPTVRPALGKSTLWRLISHLSLNYLSLIEEGREALQQILRLYDLGRTAYSQNVIESILQVRSSRHFTRVSGNNSITFARGMRVELNLDEAQFVGSGAFLFASVLERFFGLSVSLNSFTQLVVTTPQRREPLHEWQPRSGRRILV